MEGLSTPTGLWPAGNAGDRSSGHRGATLLALMGIAARFRTVLHSGTERQKSRRGAGTMRPLLSPFQGCSMLPAPLPEVSTVQGLRNLDGLAEQSLRKRRRKCRGLGPVRANSFLAHPLLSLMVETSLTYGIASEAHNPGRPPRQLGIQSA